MECRTSLTSDPNQLVFREMKRKYNECDDTQQEADLGYVCVSFSALSFLSQNPQLRLVCRDGGSFSDDKYVLFSIRKVPVLTINDDDS